MKLKRIDDIDPDDLCRCMFLNEKCTITVQLNELQMTWCQNCLGGKLIEELKRLRLTGIQP